MFTRKKLRTGIVFSLAFALIVMTAIALYGDLPHLITAIANFRWVFLPIIVGLTLFNYFCRFLKWQYYLKRLKITIAWRKSLLIFISGLSMAITPGKVGELLKSYLLKRSTGEAVSRTSPIIMAERLTDGIAMIALASMGLALYRYGWELLLALLSCVVIGILVIQNRRLSLALLAFGEHLPLVSRAARWLRAFYESSYTLLQWRPLLLAITIGIISWSGECGALYFVFAGLGLGFGLDLFIKSMFIMAVSSLVGSVSGLPGGLGTADGSMLGLTRLLLTSSAAIAGAATLLIRLCTLWFGIALGSMALLIYRATQHTAIFIQQGTGREPQTEDARSLVAPESLPDLQAAAALSNSGDTLQ
ncbi:MAG TPA: lysylphosphatidylglycerol synthase transmembrane domain-containing protein [Ktedonobacteraceae bacterium]|nr:lysylphosphatidylglycerol synthase transmembrane domain-containing protein [Ktedonobacteraceae bacterium]